jgi:hypothetical protein
VSLHPRRTTPRIIERDVAVALTLDVRDAADAQKTATAATIAIYIGSRELLAAVAVTSLGPPASYSLTAALTTSEALTDRWLEVWSMTIGGAPYVFRQPGYLVRHAYQSVVTQADLVALYPNLADTSVLPGDLTDYSGFLDRAREFVERQLIKRGRRPHLIFDSFALVDAEVHLALHYIFTYFHSDLGDGRYKELADTHRDAFDAEWKSLSFRYDETEQGTIQRDDTIASQTPLALTSGRPRSLYSRTTYRTP